MLRLAEACWKAEEIQAVSKYVPRGLGVIRSAALQGFTGKVGNVALSNY
jgi:hypothetical protein